MRNLVFILWALLLLAGPVGAQTPPLVLSTGMAEPWTNPQQTGFHQKLVAALFQRLSLTAEVEVNLASGRAVNLANDGFTDGLAGRVIGLEKEYPALVPVPEPMFVNDFVAAWQGSGVSVTDWASLSRYDVAYINGWQIFQKNVPQDLSPVLVKDSPQLLALLASRRVTVVLHERWQLLWQAKELGMSLTLSPQTLARVPMYIYLHQRHARLVEPLTQALRQMKADGSYDQIAEQAFLRLGSSVRGVK